MIGVFGILSIVGIFAVVMLPQESPKIIIQYPKNYIETDGKTLRFHVLGDFGELYPHEKFPVLPCKKVAQVMNEYADSSPISMIVSVGDNFYPPKRSDLYKFIETVLEDVFSGPEIHNIPWFLVYGNHDLYQSRTLGQKLEKIYHNIFMPQGPWNMTVALQNYSVSFTFLSGDIICHGPFNDYVLTRQCLKMKSSNNFTQEYNFLEKHLASINNDEKIKWNIVVTHYPIFSVSTTGLDAENLKYHLLPLLGKYKVDLVLTGHNHNMQHFFADYKNLSDFKIQDKNLKCLEDSRIKCKDTVLICRNSSVQCKNSKINCKEKICIDDSKGKVNQRKVVYNKGEGIQQVVQGGGGSDLDPMCPLMESPMADYLFGLVEHGFTEITITEEQLIIKYILANDSSIAFESVLNFS